MTIISVCKYNTKSSKARRKRRRRRINQNEKETALRFASHRLTIEQNVLTIIILCVVSLVNKNERRRATFGQCDYYYYLIASSIRLIGFLGK